MGCGCIRAAISSRMYSSIITASKYVWLRQIVFVVYKYLDRSVKYKAKKPI